ncbi:MAG: signal recognition particle-docking protein FtsY [Eubacterium sp.]|nr:signal recognition particle-docking protein FtsY [Eubacterium sp.]
MGFFQKLKDGLKKTSMSIANVFKVSEIDEDFFDALEETLIGADMGVETTENVIEELREKVEEKNLKDAEYTKMIIMESLMKQMTVDEHAYDFENTRSVVFVIGVNGVGKTTSIGKLAAKYKARGKKVMIAAGDTFRAGAVEQVRTWANRAGAELIAQGEGGDPSAVVFDAVSAARARNTDILLIDTAGRLHNKKNLMDELGKMRRIISKEYPEAYVETLIVLDGSTGQNALEQARQFANVTEINGIILTKLDGTAKGGIAVAIESELKVPVKYIGVGEKVEDMERFDARQYITALFEDFTMPEEAGSYVYGAYDVDNEK